MTDAHFEGRNWKYWTVPRFVNVGGLDTAYRRSGGGKAVLLYLHGLSGTREWNPLHQQLSKKFDVIAPEHPGFGDTERLTEQDSWEEYVLHYDGLIRALELEGDIHLVGTDMGAWLAAHLATFYPERFKTLTLITPMGMLVEDRPFIDIFRMTTEEELERQFNGRFDALAAEVAQEGGVDDVAYQYGQMSTAARLIWNPRYERRFATRLKRVQVPALILGAEDDRFLGKGQAEQYAARLPQATLVTVKGPDAGASSHRMTVEQPHDVARAIIEHVQARS
ncbi:Pimeloyl-ACP methyl ester carboxylesterase [Pseudomonas cedrina]|uniref:Pimeloyl-ACP methyl ester carboxylesterase n=1 Tax=Pseudomonas cedrina TaxID=651740 RepID=A0ABY0URV5_PSECE|nr:alpha/beta hydrolase [Pseudomonas cedrina]SDT08865.1 Pimeloyl-ACP methyl ester carboxylesterase [Pseudomonas cedrina]